MLIVVSATSSSGSANEHSAVRGNNNNSVSEVTRDSVDVKQFFKEKLSPSEREFFGLDSSQVCGMVIALAQRLYSSLSDFVDLIC